MESTTLTLAGRLVIEPRLAMMLVWPSLHAGEGVALDAGDVVFLRSPGDIADAGDVADRLARLLADDLQADGFVAEQGDGGGDDADFLGVDVLGDGHVQRFFGMDAVELGRHRSLARLHADQVAVARRQPGRWRAARGWSASLSS